MSAPIGVFDSGVGGLSILRALRAELPQQRYVYVADSGHAPYGERDVAHIEARALAITAELVRQGIQLLVVACNTATAQAVHLLRQRHPSLPIVGVEPALKPAVGLSRTGVIGVMATQATLASAKFQQLLASQQGQARFVLQACPGLAQAIEHDETTAILALCREHVLAMGAFGPEPGAIDTLVLGCTHYPFAQPVLQTLTGAHTRMVEPGQSVARQAQRLLPLAEHAATGGERGRIAAFTSGEPQRLQSALRRWLQVEVPVQALTV